MLRRHAAECSGALDGRHQGRAVMAEFSMSASNDETMGERAALLDTRSREGFFRAMRVPPAY